ncbi:MULTISPECIES: hemerythrin domain-containing protein [unclassified Geodermatophilus]|uniref:hemerythrin domain-containing protein n=1 Tax=unclassified Geodermatophilus TaxID=2637632 RepID=UPI003EEEB3D5
MPPVPSRVAALGDELVRIHDSLRSDLRRLQDAVADGTPSGRPLAVHCLAFCGALTRHHTGEDAGAFPALAERFPDLRPLLEKMAQDHDLISGIVARVEEIAASGDAALAGELDGLAAIMESHFSFEERRIRDALDRLDGSAADLLGA